MAKSNSVTLVRSRLMEHGVPLHAMRKGRLHKPTKMRPDIIVETPSRTVIITAVSQVRERWQLHDWRAHKVLTNLQVRSSFRALQNITSSSIELSFYLVLTEDQDVGYWRNESQYLNGNGLEAMFHVDDDDAMKAMAKACVS